MRVQESEYWDKQAKDRLAGKRVSDNWLKRQAMMAFFCKHSWLRQTVLEIGVGAGISAAMLKLSCGGMWKYIGTDVSEEFCKAARERWQLNVVQADVLSLPEGEFTRILALDSLEHVNPEDREQGYENIVSRLARRGVMFINIPLSSSNHNEQFDYGFDLTDLQILQDKGLSLENYDTYTLGFLGGIRRYAMAVLTK